MRDYDDFVYLDAAINKVLAHNCLEPADVERTSLIFGLYRDLDAVWSYGILDEHVDFAAIRHE